MTSPTSWPSFLLAIALVACGDAPVEDPPERMTTGAEDSTGGSGSGTTSVPGPDACEVTEDCGEQFCVAPYDAGASQRGPAACVATCVAEDDLVRWCIDDAACCEGLSCSAVDGFCVAGAVDGTSSTGTDTDTVTGTDTDASSSGSSGTSGGSSGSGSGGTSTSTGR